MMLDRYHISRIDWFLIIITLVLAFIGILTIYSATHNGDASLYKRQLFWLASGSAITAALIIVNYSNLEKFAYVIYGLAISSLVFALIFGRSVAGAQRWVSFGFISFQPSEFAKIAFILALARLYGGMTVPPKGMGLKELLIPGILLLTPFILIAKQPDLGTALIFVFIFISMTLIVKVRMRVVVGLSAALLAVLPFAWGHLKSYQKARLTSFLDPSVDPLRTGYHIIQSKIAVGSGGVFGKGYLKGTQGSLMFLPEQHTDFIFSILAEEFGVVGTLTVVSLFLIIVLRGLDIAGNAKDRFGFLAAFGIVAMLFWHAAINIAMVTGLLPVVGVPLPFLSYGGSFLVTMLMGIAILLNISMRKFTH